MSIKKKKDKKEKITYVDDGRTISDMSGVKGGFSFGGKKDRQAPITGETPWQTYTRAVRQMFLPMLVVIGIIALAFLLMYFLLG